MEGLSKRCSGPSRTQKADYLTLQVGELFVYCGNRLLEHLPMLRRRGPAEVVGRTSACHDKGAPLRLEGAFRLREDGPLALPAYRLVLLRFD